jgi:exodeoxyribonuclease-3
MKLTSPVRSGVWLGIGAVALAMFILAISQRSAVQANELKVMSFNVLHGGYQAEANTISAVGADIIGIQEGDNDTPAIANALGFNYHMLPITESGYNNAIITRFAITQTYTNGVKLDMGPLGEAYVFSVHLKASPYEPYRLHPQAAQLNGGTPINTGSPETDAAAAVASANSTRGAKRNHVLNEIASVVPAGAKVFLVGDFNEPSHLDWTEAAGPNGAGHHTHVVAWPSSIAVANTGFADSYRQIYPNETSKLGYTWTVLNNNPEVHDRIDFVYYKGEGLSATSSQLAGSTSNAGGVRADIMIGGYPSDHRAVLSTFDVAMPGDFNNDGVVDAADYVAWRKSSGSQYGYQMWRSNFDNSVTGAGQSRAGSAVPEPATALLLSAAVAAMIALRLRFSSSLASSRSRSTPNS